MPTVTVSETTRMISSTTEANPLGDGDGYGDNANGTRADLFPNDPNEWYDRDGDGVGDNSDDFPTDGTQWADDDGDWYGDNPLGFNGDYPNDPLRWSDRDGDNRSDQENDDAFPLDPSQWSDHGRRWIR